MGRHALQSPPHYEGEQGEHLAEYFLPHVHLSNSFFIRISSELFIQFDQCDRLQHQPDPGELLAYGDAGLFLAEAVCASAC